MLRMLLPALLLGACAMSQEQRLLSIIERPLEADGQILELTIYPYDLFGADNRYIVCFSPCTQAEAEERQSVVYAAIPGAFAGMSGQQAVTVTVQFSAACFQPGAVCSWHRPYVFREVERR